MKDLKHIFLILLPVCFIVFWSCNVSRNYKQPHFDLPNEFRLPDSIKNSNATSTIQWQDFFRDTVLSKLIARAFENNFDLRTTDKEIAINKKLFEQSKAAFLPSFNLNLLNIEKNWRSSKNRTGPENKWYDSKNKDAATNMYLSKSEYSNVAALDWEVDIWGKLRDRKEMAAALYQQSYEVRKAIQTEIVSTIAEDYYTLLMLDEQLEVAKENFHYRDSTMKMIQLQYVAGEVSALAVQQSHTQVLEAAALIPKLERDRTVLENRLRLITGELPGTIDRDITLSALDTTFEEVQNIPLREVQNRPDVLMAQYDLIAANSRVGVTQKDRLPSLSISLDGGLASLLGRNWFNIPGALMGDFTGGFTAPIFNKKKLRTNFEIAMLERDESEINFQRKVYESVVDVENALISIEKLKDQLKIAQEHQQVSQKAVESSRMLFRSGFATYLEVITAQAEALNSQLDLVQSKANLIIARIQLYRALGGGWDHSEETSE